MSLQNQNFLTPDELKAAGFSKVGASVQVSRTVRFHDVRGSLGDNARIDDYCVFSGSLTLGRYIHIGPYCLLSGRSGAITMKDGSGLSSHCSIYTASDDYQNDVLSNPTVPEDYKKVTRGPVTLGMGVIIGSHSVILPNVTIGDGASVGAQAIVHKNIPEGSVCVSGARKMEISRQRNAATIKAALAKLK